GSPGIVLPWRPEVDSFVNALVASPEAVFVGGNFKNVAGQYRPHFAIFPLEGSPRITRHPISRHAGVGETIVLEVVATGQSPLSYQWQFDGTNIAGANSSSFTIANVRISDSGEYTVMVTNALGLVNSRPALLTVIQPLFIRSQPVSQTIAPGTAATLSIEVIGHPPPIYQWRRNGVNIPGAIYSSLVISNAQPSDGGSYSVVVASLAGTLSSEVAVLRVTSPTLPFSDNLAARTTLVGPSQLGSGNNVVA